MGVAPPISSDPPFHAIARRLMQPAFSPKSIEPYREFTRSLCRRLLAPFTDATQMDISVDYAEHIPTLVIAHMIGFPPEDEALFREFVHIVLEAVDAPIEERIAILRQMEANPS
jgi:cytochrome P450